MDKKRKLEKYMEQGIEILLGSPDNPDNYIYKFKESGLCVREVLYDTNKGGEPVEICQITDTHLSILNERDMEENNPSVMSTYKERAWLRDGGGISMIKKAMEYASCFDQTIITGDVIDYLTWGSLECMKKNITDIDSDVIISLGGHDITRVMTGLVPDESTLKSRKEILKGYIPHNMDYYSRVLGNKVMVIQLNNGETRYFKGQVNKLKKDIEKAKREKLIILIFQHEPICTNNPADKECVPIRDNDDGPIVRNFCDDEKYIGSQYIDDATEEMYKLIISNADTIKGIFCGHVHYDFKTEILNRNKIIPQYILGVNAYKNGRVMKITVK